MAILFSQYKLLGTVKYRYPNREVEVIDFDRTISGIIDAVNTATSAITTIADEYDGNTSVTVAGNSNKMYVIADGETKIEITPTTTSIYQDVAGTSSAQLVLDTTSLSVTLDDAATGASTLQMDNTGSIAMAMAITGSTHSINHSATSSTDNISSGTDTYAKTTLAGSELITTGDGTNIGTTFVDSSKVQLSVGDATGLVRYGSVKVENNKISINTNPSGLANNEIIVSETTGVKITTEDHTNLVFTGTGDLQINGSAGTVGKVLTSGGAGAPPTWGKAFVTGTGALVNGVGTIANTAVTASSIIMILGGVDGTTVALGTIRLFSQTNGVGFVVKSYLSGTANTVTLTDQSPFNYLIIN